MMEERGDGSGDTESDDDDETIIEGSVTDDDEEEEERRLKRLSLISNENNTVTGLRDTNEGGPSPEIQHICKHSVYLEIMRPTEEINVQYQTMNEEEESQSLLQVERNCPVTATDICGSDCLSATAAFEEDSLFNCLDSAVTEIRETSKKNLDCDQHMHELVLSDPQNFTSYNKPTEKGNSVLKNASSCDLKKPARKRKDLTDSDVDTMGDILRREHKSNAEDKSDRYLQPGIRSDINSKVEQTRKSQRIAQKARKQSISKNYFCGTTSSCISLSKINRRDIWGQTLLHRAAMEGDLDSICAMIKAGANVNAQDYAGWTPLHEASIDGFFEITKELLQAGADVNCKGSEQVTPLLDAVKKGHYKVAELLLWYGADPLFRNEKGKSVLEEATDKHMRKLLERYIAKRSKKPAYAEKIIENPVIDHSGKDKSKPMRKRSSSGKVQSSFHDSTKVLKQHNTKVAQNKGKRNSVSKVQKNCKILNETPLISAYLVPTKTKQSKSPPSSLGISGNRAKINDPSEGTLNDSGDSTDLSFSNRMVRSPVYNPDRICEAAEVSCMLLKSEILKRNDSSISNSNCLSERKDIHPRNESSEITDAQITSSNSVTSLVPTLEDSALLSVTNPGNDSNTDLLCNDLSSTLMEEQCAMKHCNDPALRDNVNTADKKNKSPKQSMYSEKSEEQINLDCDRGIILEQEHHIEDSLSLSESIYIENNLLNSKNTTMLSMQGTPQLTDSDCTIVSEQYNLNRDESPDKNIIKKVGICSEQTPQVSVETSLSYVFSQGVNRIGVSESLDNYSSTELRIVTPRMDEGIIMGLTAEENAEKYCLVRTETDSKLENNTCPALQVLDEGLFQDSLHSSEKEIMASSSQQLGTSATRVNKRNAKGETRLHLAAKKGDLLLVKSLIESGACVNQKDNAGWTAIHEASSGGFTEVISELLKAGADVNSRSMDGILPIHDAVSSNHFEAVQLLLQHGANPNETDKYGENALNKATCDTIKELLKSYSATETKVTSRMNDVAGRRELCPSRPRKTRSCSECSEKDKLVSHASAARQKCGILEPVSEILQDIEEKQDRLLHFELNSQSEADLYIQDLCQIQNVLNAVLAKQKSERDDLARKYRASVDSFKQGPLRTKLVKLASRQKSLLHMAQKQKELGKKIQNYKRALSDSSRSVKQVPSTFDSCESNNTKDGASAKTSQCPNVVIMSFNSQMNQNQNKCLNVSGGNGEAITQKEIELHKLICETKVREYITDEVSDSVSTDAIELSALPSEIHLIQTKHSQVKNIFVSPLRDSPPNVTPRTCTLNISGDGSISVNNKINEPINKNQYVCSDEPLQQHLNINTDIHEQPMVALESTHRNLATNQTDISPSNGASLDANLQPAWKLSCMTSPGRISQNSTQCSDNQDSEKQLDLKANRRKKNQLLALLELGKVMPGNDVLEFTLQGSKHKASLLGNGKIKADNTIYQNLVQWIRALLGNDISVSWKYVWNKVTYSGTLLSKIIAEVHIPEEQQLPNQQKKLLGRNSAGWDQNNDSVHCSYAANVSFQEADNTQEEATPVFQEEMGTPPSCEIEAKKTCAVINQIQSSHQFNSSKNQKRFLQFNEKVLIRDEEFLPCHIMNQYWNFYVHCENFGF